MLSPISSNSIAPVPADPMVIDVTAVPDPMAPSIVVVPFPELMTKASEPLPVPVVLRVLIQKG